MVVRRRLQSEELGHPSAGTGVLRRLPRAELRSLVRCVWASDGALRHRRGRELMLPSASPHLVIRLDGEPLRLFTDTVSPTGSALGPATVGGPRWASYVRARGGAGRTVGAVLAPGAFRALLGAPGVELAARHTDLRDLLGRRADEMRERLAQTRCLPEVLDLFEELLLENMRPSAQPHPVVVFALQSFERATSVRAVVEESGYSHRRFNERFAEAVGMPPKLYCRVVRLERLLRRWQCRPEVPFATLAADMGYADQAHLSREFRRLTGVTMSQYSSATTPGSRHVPLRV